MFPFSNRNSIALCATALWMGSATTARFARVAVTVPNATTSSVMKYFSAGLPIFTLNSSAPAYFSLGLAAGQLKKRVPTWIIAGNVAC